MRGMYFLANKMNEHSFNRSMSLLIQEYGKE